jgi:hypothetical protein
MSRASHTQKEMAEELDTILVSILKDGQVVTVKGDDGVETPVKISPTAAMLNVVRQRLKDLGIQSVPVAGSPAGNLLEAARLRFPGLPELSDAEDEATGT